MCADLKQAQATPSPNLGVTPPVIINVDAGGTGSLAELPRFFQGTGFTPSAVLLTELGRLTMLMASGGGYRYMRVHCMLDLIDIQGTASQPLANYSKLDKAFDAIVSAGLIPIVNIDGTPTGVLHRLFIENDFLNNAKLLAWRDMIEALGRHLVQRYGAATHNWFFEHW